MRGRGLSFIRGPMPLDVHNAVMEKRANELRGSLSRIADVVRGRAVTLEIGCGHGHFLTAYAKAHPERVCIGVDLLEDRLVRAGRKSEREGLGNVFWVRAEASMLLDKLPPELKPDVVFVLFPDPWPKRRHWKNRLLQEAFLNRLADKLPSGTRLFFRTDHEPYFKQAQDVVTAHPAWELREDNEWPFELETVFQRRAAGYQSLAARLKT